MTAISFQCPKCRATHKTKVENAGKRARCPKCGDMLVVPSPPLGAEAEGRDEGEQRQPVLVEQPLGPSSTAKVTKTAAQRQTAFRGYALRWQQLQRRTAKDDVLGIIKTFFSTLGGLACLLLGLIGVPASVVVGSQAGGLGLLGLVVSAVLLVFGFLLGGVSLFGTMVGLGRVFFASRKEVLCPACEARHKMYTSAKSFMCLDCYELLFLGSDASLQPQFAPCPYCGRRTALCSDHGPFSCPNCGLLRLADDEQSEAVTQPCPKCIQPIPDGVFFCNHCRLIVRTDFGQLYYPWLDDIDQSLEENRHTSSTAKQGRYDFEWEIGKDGIGHLQFARALLRATDKDAGESSATNITHLIRVLTKALMSMEEAALYDTACLREVLTLVPEMDVAYAALLNCQCSAVDFVKRADAAYAALLNREFRSVEVVKSPGNAEAAEEEQTLRYVLEDESHIVARKRLEKILGDSFESTGGGRYVIRDTRQLAQIDWGGDTWSEMVDKLLISAGGGGAWSEHLVSTDMDKEGNFRINCHKLKAERDRFRLKRGRK